MAESIFLILWDGLRWLGRKLFRFLLWTLGIGLVFAVLAVCISVGGESEQSQELETEIEETVAVSKSTYVTAIEHQNAMLNTTVSYSIDLVDVVALIVSSTPERIEGLERVLDARLNSLQGDTLLDIWATTEAHHSTYESWEMSGRHPNYDNCFTMTSFAMLETARQQCWASDDFATRDVTDALSVVAVEYWFVDIDRLVRELEVVEDVLYL